MGNGKWLYGRAIVNGVPQFHSVSRLTGADDTHGGCLRQWFYEMKMGKKAPGTTASKRGDGLHEEIEKFLKTGDRSLSSLALSGMHMVPEPGPDLLVEHDLVLRPDDLHPKNEAEAAALLARAPLTADGVPVLGRMDLIHGRGTNKGGANVEDTLDPPNTVEVCDWKSTGSPKWIKKKEELPKLIQMAGYAEWVYRVEPRTDQVRLSHGYFVVAGGASRKVSLRVHREDIEKTWQHAEGVARRIRHAAAEIDPDLVDANTGACENYGGCTHREYCKARMHVALTSFVGQTAAAKLLNKHQENSMGLLDKLKSGALAPAAPAAVAPAPSGILGIAAPAAPAAPAIDAAAERAKLEAEEVAQRAARALIELTDKCGPLFDKINGYAQVNGEAVGVPSFAGDIAAVLTKGASRDPITGVGTLGGKCTISTYDELVDVVEQLDRYAKEGAIKSIPPPPGTVMPRAPTLLSPETPASAPSPVVVTIGAEGAPAGSTSVTVEATKTRAPRAKKDTAAPAETPAHPSVPRGPDPTPAPSAPPNAMFGLVVDAVLEIGGTTGRSLNAWVEEVCAELAAQFGDADVRCPTEKSPLAFGKWDGAVAAMIREKAPSLPPGIYVLDTRGSRALEVAADALRGHCRTTGGFFVWGRR